MSRVPRPGDAPREGPRTTDTSPHAAYRARSTTIGTTMNGADGGATPAGRAASSWTNRVAP
jgi:hypothetical protein